MDPHVVSVFMTMGANAHLQVFAIGTDGTLYYRNLNNHGVWSAWTSSPSQAPKVKSINLHMGPVGNLEAFIISSEGKLLHNYQTPAGAWNTWKTL